MSATTLLGARYFLMTGNDLISMLRSLLRCQDCSELAVDAHMLVDNLGGFWGSFFRERILRVSIIIHCLRQACYHGSGSSRTIHTWYRS